MLALAHRPLGHRDQVTTVVHISNTSTFIFSCWSPRPVPSPLLHHRVFSIPSPVYCYHTWTPPPSIVHYCFSVPRLFINHRGSYRSSADVIVLLLYHHCVWTTCRHSSNSVNPYHATFFAYMDALLPYMDTSFLHYPLLLLGSSALRQPWQVVSLVGGRHCLIFVPSLCLNHMLSK